jgi:hypothetical protein
MLAGILTRGAAEPPSAGSAAAFTPTVLFEVEAAAVMEAGERIDESCRKPTTASLAAAARSGLAAAGWRLRR